LTCLKLADELLCFVGITLERLNGVAGDAGYVLDDVAFVRIENPFDYVAERDAQRCLT